MPTNYELTQATGVQSQIIYAVEALWGNAPATSTYKKWNTVVGENLDQQIALYRSAVIRSDAERNASKRGVEGPGGRLPFELSVKGQAEFFVNLLRTTTVTSTGSGPYNHVIKGGTTVWEGLSIEKGFLDLPVPTYYAFLGNRVDQCQLSVQQGIITGAFDVLSREMVESTASIVAGSAADMTSEVLCGCEALVYEGSSLSILGNCESMNITIANNYNKDNYAIGSKKRVNLKPGTRTVDFNGVFKFSSKAMYDEAVAGTNTKIQLSAFDTAGVYGYTILLPAVTLIPTGNTPKINTDGPITISMSGEATKDASEGTSIKITITSPSASIST